MLDTAVFVCYNAEKLKTMNKILSLLGPIRDIFLEIVKYVVSDYQGLPMVLLVLLLVFSAGFIFFWIEMKNWRDWILYICSIIGVISILNGFIYLTSLQSNFDFFDDLHFNVYDVACFVLILIYCIVLVTLSMLAPLVIRFLKNHSKTMLDEVV